MRGENLFPVPQTVPHLNQLRVSDIESGCNHHLGHLDLPMLTIEKHKICVNKLRAEKLPFAFHRIMAAVVAVDKRRRRGHCIEYDKRGGHQLRGCQRSQQKVVCNTYGSRYVIRLLPCMS